MSRFTVASVVALVAVVAVTGIAAIQLARTVRAAAQINDKAARIADSGRGINLATDSVIQLDRTNDTASSILRSAAPLEGKLAKVVEEAQAINRVARSINGNAGTIDRTAAGIDATAADIDRSAGAIESTAGDIDATAAGIDARTTGILDVAERIDVDVRLINVFVDQSIRIARQIKGDTGDILDQALDAHDTAACIDRKVGGAAAADGHCEGREGEGASAAGVPGAGGPNGTGTLGPPVLAPDESPATPPGGAEQPGEPPPERGGPGIQLPLPKGVPGAP